MTRVLRNSGIPRFPVRRFQTKLANMRKLNTLALAIAGMALFAGSLSFALAASSAAPTLTRRAIVPAVASDDSSFNPGQQSTPTPEPFGCAGLRTPIKILTDPDAGFDRTPVASSFAALSGATRPDGITDSTPRFEPFESQVVEITAALVGFRRTSGGGVELVITQGGGGDLVAASFPSPSCLATASDADRAAVNMARIALAQSCGNPPDSGIFKPLGGTATLRGVPFWGSKRTDGYGASSGVELGPVLGFTFNPATSCDADAAKTPYPTATSTPVLQEMTINVSPAQPSPGDALVVTIRTIPAVVGRSCSFKIYDSTMRFVAEGTTLTNAQGEAIFQTTLPADTALGVGGATPYCVGGNTDGSFLLRVVAPPGQ